MATTLGRFEGRRAAVTGAAGFIGGALARRLRAEGAEVVGIDVAEDRDGALSAAGIEARRADITDGAALADALAGCDLAFHTAAYVHEWGTMEEFVRVNVGGTASVLDAATGAGVERVVHVSSVVVYGYDNPGVQDERSHLRSYGIPYIDTKAASDRLARRRGAVVVRPGDVYGPASLPWFVRPLKLVIAGRFALPGRGDGNMLPVYVDDLVESFLLAALRGEDGEAYTAWHGTPVTFGEYFDLMAANAGVPAPRRLPRPVLDAGGAIVERIAALRGSPPPFTSRSATFIDRRGTVTNARARDELGWEPQVELAEGLERCHEWALEEGLLSEV